MKPTLQPGLTFEHTYPIPQSKTVPFLYPESPEYQAMPEVFATGYMVGLLEWACILAINPHLDWPVEQTVGTHINVSHSAPTPPGMTVTALVKLVEVDGRRLKFEVSAHDGVDTIAEGTHERYIINREKFVQKVKEKAMKAG